ncbi:glutathione S-transferase family protein [Bradyrhizobium rifense]|uniref:Glutathione S-transferase family protein n=1 Tax=Bradyrhizobium rifense TaxID=515499 RepID=A0A5D3KNM0_9BRAD|nr:glutathione S-transferase family protein [Bradyrhizobium rifense]TYL98065.1 glutathione S-transferase family protein [Bradyrhizobium rifense]
MLLIGVNRSPFTRRVAITLNIYGVPFEQRALSGFGDRAEVRASNPLGRIPALVLDSGETLIDSDAIIDHLDEAYGGDQPLTPREGANRRAVLKVTAMMMGVCEKCLHAAYEGNHRPSEKVHRPWIDDCMAQAANALNAIEAMIEPKQPYLLLERLTQADVTAVVTERLARARGIDTDVHMPGLRALTSRLAEQPLFQVSEP